VKSVRFIVIFCLILGAELSAQVERVLPKRGSSSVEGTEFIVGFLQNEFYQASDYARLQIFLSSQYDANVRIELPDGNLIRKRLSANTVEIETIPAFHQIRRSEIVERRSITITSDVPIIVSLLNTLSQSTDSYTAIPTKHLGMDYISVCRPIDRYPIMSLNSATSDTIGRAGQFAVIATENATDIEIVPSTVTETGRLANVPMYVRLNRGETFLVRARVDTTGRSDLSGSRVRSSKPVGFLSGHLRTSVPTNRVFSKDHLVEMLPSLDKWGKRYATTPFALVRPQDPDRIRLVAAQDGTTINYTSPLGPGTIALDEGEYFEASVSVPVLWESDKPFLVVQFMPSRYRPDDNYDPAMVVIPPVEQFVQSAIFQFPTLEINEDLGSAQEFFYYVNIVADSAAIPTLRLNGQLVTTLAPIIQVNRIPGSTLRWAQVRLAQGAYSLTADEGTFSGIIYGTSLADSYAHIIGMRYGPLQKIDNSPPRYALQVDCGRVTGFVTDTTVGDTAKITEIEVVTSQTKNYTWTIGLPKDSVGTSDITAAVRDMWNDARIVFHTWDKNGNGKEWLYDYDAPNITVPQFVDIDIIGSSGTFCTPFTIRNADTTPVRIQNLKISGDTRYSIVAPTDRDTILGAGDSIVVTVCFTITTDTSGPRTATIAIELPCDLQRTAIVRSASVAAITTRDHDFGDVRIGDTACARIPIVNVGSIPVTIQDLVLGSLLVEFYIDSAGSDIDSMILPGDTAWIRVCYSPNDTVYSRRTDTIVTSPDLGERYTVTGRGVRPNVRNIVIDWGRRRVGLVHDTTFVFANTGHVETQLTKIQSLGDTSSFPPGDMFVAQVNVPKLSQTLPFDVSFAPQREGFAEFRMVWLSDWALHDTILVVVRGIGVLPAIETFDIDMGNVIVGQQKDSTVAYVRSIGTDVLRIVQATAEGADIPSFTVPQSVYSLRSLAATVSFAENLRFAPQRVGPHTMRIAVIHDGIPGNEQDTAYIQIRGNGIPAPFTRLTTELTAPIDLPTCVDTVATLDIINEGNVDLLVTGIRSTAAGIPYDHSIDMSLPQVLISGQTMTVTLRFTPDRSTPNELSVTIDTSGVVARVIQRTFSVTTPQADLTATPVVNISPGQNLGITLTARQDEPQTVATSVSGTVTADEKVWSGIVGVTRAQGSDADGSVTTTATITRENTGLVRWTLDEPVRAPWIITVDLPGSLLWKDPIPFVVTSTVEDGLCHNGKSVQTLVNADVCADALRMVRLNVLPEVRVRAVSEIVRDDLELVIFSTKDVDVDVVLVDITGRFDVLAEKLSLNTGETRVKFSCSDRPSGWYRFGVRYLNGETGGPVMFVK